MSAWLTGMVKRARFGEERSNRKVALMSLADAANDKGEGIVATLDEIMDVAEVSESTAKRIRREFVRTGLLKVTSEGGGRRKKSQFILDVDLIGLLSQHLQTYAGLLAVADARAPETDDTGNGVNMTPFAEPAETADAHPKTGSERGSETGSQTGSERGSQTGSRSRSPSPCPPPLPCTLPHPLLSPSLSLEARASAISNDLAGQVAADGRDLHVVECLLRPIVAGLDPPKTVDPLSRLRAIRDDLAGQSPLVLKRAASALRLSRRAWPNSAEVIDACRKVTGLVHLTPASPGWSAWMAEVERNPEFGWRSVYETQGRGAFPSPWPPGMQPAPQLVAATATAESERKPSAPPAATPDEKARVGKMMADLAAQMTASLQANERLPLKTGRLPRPRS